MESTALALQIQTLPDNPGVYQYYDKEGKLLYVGKAKNLRKRVSSYFNKVHDVGRTNVLVKKIKTIKHIVVPTETDALLLENNLIKKYQPRYNVLLRDDKTYPWICIKKEPFSRIFSTRRMVKDGSDYFGPYTSFKTVHTILDLIKELYPLRTCNYDLSEKNIDQINRNAELYISLGENIPGGGTDAVNALVHFCFMHLNLHKIYLYVFESN